MLATLIVNIIWKFVFIYYVMLKKDAEVKRSTSSLPFPLHVNIDQ